MNLHEFPSSLNKTFSFLLVDFLKGLQEEDYIAITKSRDTSAKLSCDSNSNRVFGECIGAIERLASELNANQE